MDDDEDNSRYDFLMHYFRKYNISHNKYNDYFSNGRFHRHIEELEARQNISKTQYWLTFSTDLTNVFLIPCTIIISFLLNLICISIFTSSYLKSTIYKYLSANSIIDCIMLIVALLGLFVYSDTYSSAQYLFIYLSFTALTASNMIKIALSLDRIFRLKKVAKFFVRKTSFKWIMSIIVVFSAAVNSPKLMFYNLYSNTWQRNNFLTVTLTTDGNKTVTGPLLIISTILIELIPYIIVVVLNIVLLVAVKEHLVKLKSMEEMSEESVVEGECTPEKLPSTPGTPGTPTTPTTPTNMLKKKRIHFDIYDQDDSDEDTDEVVIPNLESDSTIDVRKKKKKKEKKIKSKSKEAEAEEGNAKSEANSEANGEDEEDDDDDESSDDEKPEKLEPMDMRTDIEITRFSLTKMLQLSYIVYILGHSLFVFTSIFVQIKYFFYYGPLMNVFQKNLLVINLLIALSYWFLYISFGANFFVYFAFNSLFRKIITKTTESKDEKKHGEDGECSNSDGKDEFSIAKNF